MKKYVKKQFEDGETYIEAIPAGYPDWWDEFKKIVNNSFSLNELFLKLMEFEHYSNVPRIINGQIVFNPLVYDFLINNQESLKTFNKGHEKGKKDFKKNYFKKYPNEEQAKTIFTLYNNQFKETILRGDGFFNDSNIMMLGYSNGILTGYWQFENDHLTEFEITEENKETQKIKEIEEYFYNLKDKEAFLLELRETFTTEKGIDFRILLELLKDEKILLIGNREFSKFHKVCKLFFDHNIGTKPAINDTYKHTDTDKKIYKPNIEIISKKLNPLINRHKVNVL